MKIGIVTDDLTGAADSSAPFASRGMRCSAAIGDLPTSGRLLTGYDVVSVSTETRDVSNDHQDIIYSFVTEAVNELYAIGRPDILCKKIDSTLRGNLSVELSAICAGSPKRIPVICPAFPAQGRIVVDGKLIVGGEYRPCVHEAFDSDLHSLGGFIGLADIRRGAEWVRQQLETKARSGVRAVFFDAEMDSDLAELAKAVVKAPNSWLPVGSAGFMSAIAAAVSPNQIRNPRYAQAKEEFTSGPVLYICGSKSIVSRNQLTELERAAATARVSTVSEAIQSIMDGNRIAIAASSDDEQDRDVVLQNLLSGVDALGHLAPSTAMVVTGGATAAALLRKLASFSHLDVLGEIEPGVVITNVVFRSSGNMRTLPTHLVLKAGAFGDAQTLARIAGI